jgi:glutathione S-transferase
MTMKLHYHPLSTYSQKTLIALYEKGASFTPEIVDMFDPVKNAEYRKLYPFGKIPLLIDGDRFIPESSIIIEYVDQTVPGAALIPADRELGRKARFFDRMNDNYVNEPTATLFFETQKPATEDRTAAIAKARATLDISFKNLDGQLAKNTWLAGDTFTIADCAAAPALNYLRRLHPYTEHANLTAYWNRLAERASVRRVLDEAAPYLAKMG